MAKQSAGYDPLAHGGRLWRVLYLDFRGRRLTATVRAVSEAAAREEQFRAADCLKVLGADVAVAQCAAKARYQGRNDGRRP